MKPRPAAAALVVLLAACGGPAAERGAGPAAPAAVSSPSAPPPAGQRTTGESAEPRAGLPVVSWEDASRYYGRRVIVEGTVVAAKNTGRACFLNFHRNWKRYFTAVIFAKNFDRFSSPPEKAYAGRKVQVIGQVREYQGKPEIVVESPAQIRILN